jgi:hypothetical protein
MDRKFKAYQTTGTNKWEKKHIKQRRTNKWGNISLLFSVKPVKKTRFYNIQSTSQASHLNSKILQVCKVLNFTGIQSPNSHSHVEVEKSNCNCQDVLSLADNLHIDNNLPNSIPVSNNTSCLNMSTQFVPLWITAPPLNQHNHRLNHCNHPFPCSLPGFSMCLVTTPTTREIFEHFLPIRI